MKIILFKKLSLLGLVLTGVSAITTSMITSKSNAKVQGLPGNGRLVLSSFAGMPDPGNLTVVLTAAGPNSHTTTGNPCDEYDDKSATSIEDDACTFTQEMGSMTASETTTQE